MLGFDFDMTVEIQKEIDKDTVLHQMIARDQTNEALSYIDAQEIDLEEINHMGENYLIHAIDRCNPTIVDALIKKGANVESIHRNICGVNYTALQYAINLIDMYVKPFSQIGQSYFTLFGLAPSKILPRNKEVVHLLIQAGANQTVLDDYNNSLLHKLIQKVDFDPALTLLLIKGNPNIDLPNKQGKTVREGLLKKLDDRQNSILHFILQNEPLDLEVLALLLDGNPNIDLPNSEGITVRRLLYSNPELRGLVTDDIYTSSVALDVLAQKFGEFALLDKAFSEIADKIVKENHPRYLPQCLLQKYQEKVQESVEAMDLIRDKKIESQLSSLSSFQNKM